MPLLSRPGFGPKAALIYVTVGSLIDVWVAVWYFTMVRGAEAETPRTTWFWLTGLFLTGLSLLIIGLLLGRIGQSARRSEMPPSEVVRSEAVIQQNAGAAGVPGAGMPVAPPGTAVPVAPVQMAPMAPAAPVAPAAPIAGTPLARR